MSQQTLRFSALVLGTILFAAPVVAHHAFATEFDATKPVTITGFVTKVQWTNPHAWFYVNVTDDTGKIENWGFEMGSPNSLYNNGWTRDSLQIGEEVTVDGTMARDGSNRVNARDVTMVRTGQQFGAASSQNDSQ
jgi:hypothetical protein